MSTLDPIDAVFTWVREPSSAAESQSLRASARLPRCQRWSSSSRGPTQRRGVHTCRACCAVARRPGTEDTEDEGSHVERCGAHSPTVRTDV